MSDEKESPSEGKERRKYPRVHLDDTPKALKVDLVGYGPSLVYDMSFSGAALAQPKEKKVGTEDSSVTVRLESDDEGSQILCEVISRVIRRTESMVALEFAEVPTEARSLIDQVISDRVIGLNMNLIDPKHYGPSTTFTYWFHGPKETNLFLWEMESGDIEKAQFDLNDTVLVYEAETFLFEAKPGETPPEAIRPQKVLQKAFSILSQMQTNLESLGEFKGLLKQQIQL